MCVFCVLFFFFFFFFLRPNLSPPCLLCPMSPALPGGGGAVVGAEASRYLYRPNSWGPPRQSREGWVGEKRNKDHRNFRLNQALEMSLCCLFVFLAIFLFVVLSFSPGCPLVAMSGQSDGQTTKHHWLISISSSTFFLLPLFFFSLFSSSTFCPVVAPEPTGRRKAELLLLI